jgi:hypothetical protein
MIRHYKAWPYGLKGLVMGFINPYKPLPQGLARLFKALAL